MTTPRLLIPEISENQASKYLTHNEALRVIDTLVQLSVQAQQNDPPGAPTNGQSWIVGASPTGAWVGKANQIAQWYNSAWYFHVPFNGWKAFNVALGYEVFYNGSAWTAAATVNVVQSFVLPVSGTLTAGTNKYVFRMPFAFTVTGVKASLSTAQTSGSIFTVDINENGTSILSTKLTIDNTEKTSATAATAAVVSDANLANDAEITVDIDQIGDGTAADLKVYLIGTKV